MKYRLVELLECPRCSGDFDLVVAQSRPAPNVTKNVFSCCRYCAFDKSTTIPGASRCAECMQTEIVTGTLACRACGQAFRIVGAVPWLFELFVGPTGSQVSDTVSLYSHVWNKIAGAASEGSAHVYGVEAALEESVVQGPIGLDAGSGYGLDTATMARRDPSVEIISLDLSEGVYATRQATEGMPNVHVIRGSVLRLPLKSAVCHFVYSFGVLHHTPDPPRGLRELVRVLKGRGALSLYLYEDHADNMWKALPLRLVNVVRRITTRLSPSALSLVCYALSPLIVLMFSLPAKLMQQFGPTRAWAEKMPFNFGTAPFSIHSDLMDRFGAPVEFRYSRGGIIALLEACGLVVGRTTKMKTAAGWVARSIKPDM